MTPRSSRRIAGPGRCGVGLAALLWSACSFAPALAPGAQITCEVDGECPDGLLCSVELGRCAPPNATAPEISEVTAEPGIARVGQRVDVRFSSTLPLDDATEVRIDTGLEVRTFERVAQDHFTYDVVGDEFEGARAISVRAVSSDGGVQVVVVDPVVFDFTPPTVIDETLFVTFVTASDIPDVAPVAAGLGAVVRVGFAVSEALALEPTPTVAGVELLRIAGAPLFVVEGPVTEATPEGALAFEVTLEDRAGNTTTERRDLPLNVDRTPPVLGADGLLLRRAPFGPTPTITVEGRGEPGESFIVLDAALEELGRATVDPQGDARVSLAFDQERVNAVLVDDAGNSSVTRLVSQVELTVEPGPLSRTWQEQRAGPALRPAVPVGRSAVDYDAGAAETRAAGVWTTLYDGGTRPPVAGDYGFAWDRARGVTVRFGGEFVAVTNDTWEWDGRVWREMRPENSPPPAAHPLMFYDARRARTVLFLDEVFEWDGVDWTPLGVTVPFERPGAAVTWDERRGVAVVFGGTGDFDQFFEWDGEAFIDRSDAQRPPGRTAAAMAFEPSSGRVILHGGADALTGIYTDTWALDDEGWRQLPDGPRRMNHAMAYDSAGRAIIIGGQDGTAALDESHVLVDDVWQPGPPLDVEVNARHGAVVDETRGAVVVGTGILIFNFINDLTTELAADGLTFESRAARFQPPPMTSPCAAFADDLNQALFVFGSIDDRNTNQVFGFDGDAFVVLDAATGPAGRGPRTSPICAYREGRLWTLGGSRFPLVLTDTWSWAPTAWRTETTLLEGVAGSGALHPFGLLVGVGSSKTLVTDLNDQPIAHTLVDDLGSLSGSRVASGGPLFRYGGSAAGQSSDALAVFDLFAGGWTSVPRVEPWPPPLSNHVMVHHPGRGTTLVTAGANGVIPSVATWELLPDRTWREVPVVPSLPALSLAGGVYIPDEDAVFIYGGTQNNVTQDDLLRFDHPDGARAAHGMTVELAAMTVEGVVVDEVDIEWAAGADGLEGAGAALEYWGDAGWVRLVGNASSVPERLSATLDGGEVARPRAFSVRVIAVEGAGEVGDVLRSEGPRVVVRYRLE